MLLDLLLDHLDLLDLLDLLNLLNMLHLLNLLNKVLLLLRNGPHLLLHLLNMLNRWLLDGQEGGTIGRLNLLQLHRSESW